MVRVEKRTLLTRKTEQSIQDMIGEGSSGAKKKEDPLLPALEGNEMHYCWTYVYTGTCGQGNNCKFEHKKPPGKFPCWFFHNGTGEYICKLGDKCSFAHAKMTKSQAAVFAKLPRPVRRSETTAGQ